MTEDEDIFARTLYGEARGEYARADGGLCALIAVGNVIMNRVQTKGRFRDTVRDVCLQPYQFSCWNTTDVNRRIIESVKGESKIFLKCVEVAQHLIAGDWPDLTQGCDHYHAVYVAPRWAKNVTPKLKLGHHLFYTI